MAVLSKQFELIMASDGLFLNYFFSVLMVQEFWVDTCILIVIYTRRFEHTLLNLNVSCIPLGPDCPKSALRM